MIPWSWDILKKRPHAVVLYTLLVLADIVLNLVLPANQATVRSYHLSLTEYHVLIFLIDLPIAAIWFIAFYGYRMLQEYSKVIKDSREGLSFHRIMRGLMWLAWGQPISSVIVVILYAFVHHWAGFYTTALIINHYMSLFIAIVAYTLIGAGTHILAERGRQPSSAVIRVLMVGFTAFGVLYTYFTFSQVTTQHPNAYLLPLWFVLLTVVVPYLYAWYMGLYSAYEMLMYRQYARGVLYRQALTYIATGIGTIITSSIVVEFLTSDTRYLTRLRLNGVLLLVYLFLFIYGLGFALVAFGTKRLKKIEEV